MIIKLIDHSPKWVDYFKEESDQIQNLLGNHLNEIHHIGSTAIAGIAAKPVIDIMLEFKDLDQIDEIWQSLAQLNYRALRGHIGPHRSYFTRRADSDITYHLHLRESGDPQLNRHVNFRNYMNAHPDKAQAYAKLKLNLAQQHIDNINAYVAGKDKFIQEIDRLAKTWPQRRQNFAPANTGQNIGNWSNEKLVKAMEANLNLHMTYYAQYLSQVNFIRVPGYTLVNSALPDAAFNYILEANFSEEEADTLIPAIINNFATYCSDLPTQKVPFSWWISPCDKPQNLTTLLEKYQLQLAETNMGMYLDLDQYLSSAENKDHLEIKQAKTQTELLDFALALTNDKQAFVDYYSALAAVITDEDPIKFYVGYIDNKPVTRGLVVYLAQVAGIYAISTDPAYRYRGYARIMEEFLLTQAKNLGYHIAVLQAAPTGLAFHQKLGFKECCIFKEYKYI